LSAQSPKEQREAKLHSGGGVRYFINIGSRDDFNWMQLKDFLKEVLELGRDDVYKVDVKEGFSFFNTDAEHSERVVETLNNITLEGRRVNVEISKNDGFESNSPRRDHGGRKSGNFTRSDKGGFNSDKGGFGDKKFGGKKEFGAKKEFGGKSDFGSRDAAGSGSRNRPDSFAPRAPRRSESADSPKPRRTRKD
jgi:ATP-dependent RNA helicase DeaD